MAFRFFVFFVSISLLLLFVDIHTLIIASDEAFAV